MRICIAGILHESNTFSTLPTGRRAFEDGGLKFAGQILNEWAEAHHEVGGFLQGAADFGYEVLPSVVAWAMPAGPVTDAMIDEVVHRIVQDIKSAHGVEGLLLALHGAMVAESYPDGDGEVLARLRDALGRNFPIVNTFDFHGNCSQKQVDNSSAIVYYQTNPHVDQRQRGLIAAELMTRLVRGQISPTMALAKPPMIFSIVYQNTSAEPLRGLLADARRRESQNPALLVANIVAGFPYADVPQMGPSVVTVTDNNAELARRQAGELAAEMYALREHLVVDLPGPAEAVAQAIRSDRQPVVLVDFGDNVGGGSAADSTFILGELIRQKAHGAVVALYAPDAVTQCSQAGIGATVNLKVGGKVDRLHGSPVEVSGIVRNVYDGRWIEDQPRHGGKRFNDQGLSAVVEIPGPNTLLLTSLRQPPFSLGQLTSAGIDPTRARILVVKAAIAYKAAYEPIAARIIEVDTPGLTAVNPNHFDYRHIRRPVFPLDR